MKRKKLFENKTDYLIAAFVVGGLLLLAAEIVRADWGMEFTHDSNAGSTTFNSGYDRLCGRYFFDTGSSATFCPVVGVGGTPKSDSFEIGIADELWPRWEGQITMSRYDGVMYGGGSIRRVMGDGPFNLYLGLTGWITESPGSSSDVTFNLGVRYTFRKVQ